MQKQKLQARIDELRAQQKKDSESLPMINKVLDGIKERINKVKGQQTVIEVTKANFSE